MSWQRRRSRLRRRNGRRSRSPSRLRAQAGQPVDPAKVHELFGVVPLYGDPPKPPPDLPGYATFWDPGCSVLHVRERHPALFFPDTWYEKQAFARQTDARRWRQIRLAPILPDHPTEEQLRKLPKGDAVASARELVVFLALHFFSTGERLPLGGRCREVLPSGRRVIAGPLHELGLTLGSMSDGWASPAYGLIAVFTPKK